MEKGMPKPKSFLVSCDSGISAVCSASEAKGRVPASASPSKLLRDALRGKYLRQQHNPVLLGCSETPQSGGEGALDRAA